ncbi:cohesin domain-containing protein, partial [Saprospiraceae bacterium]|nr:cohesin domain-containing protein [Saprospiraceae bacterium]
VRVSDFTDIAGMQIAVHWDETVLEVNSIRNLNPLLSGFSQSNFGFGTPGLFGDLRMSWSSTLEATLPDDAILFTIRMNAIGSDCDFTGFSIFGSDDFPIEIFDFDLNFKEFCTNTYVSQISGPACVAPAVLSCNNNINVSIGDSKVVLVFPDIVLEGGPYDYTRINVVPAKLTCADEGQAITYTATDAATGNSCFGTITVDDFIGVCDGFVGGNGPLVCNATVNVSLGAQGEAQIFPENVLEGSYDFSTITVTPSLIDCDDLGVTQFVVNDSSTGNSCFGQYVVLDILGSCGECVMPDTESPTPFCISSVRVVVPTVGSIAVFASQFNDSSFDNCTLQGDLRYTFSDIDPNNDPDYDALNNSSKIEYTNAILNGTGIRVLPVDMYVWDENSNRDFCTVELILIDDSSNSSDLTLSMSDVVAGTGDQVCVPLKASNFQGVSTMQGTISWDSQVATFSRAQSFALPGMSTGSVNASNDNLTFVWFDNTGNTPVTLPNSATVFEVCFDVVGTTGQSTALNLVDDPTSLTLTNNAGLPFDVRRVSGSITVDGVSDCNIDLEAPIPFCISQSTAVINQGSVEVFAIDFDFGSTDNCTSNNELRFTFSDIDPNNDPDYVAASNSSVRQFTDADLNGMNSRTFTIDMYVWDENSNRDFCRVSLTLLDDNSGASDVTLSMPDVVAESGSQICVPVRATGFENKSAVQGTIEWDSQVITYNSTQGYALPGLNENSFFNASAGKLTFVWFDLTGSTPSTLSNGASVFEVCFDVIGATGQSTALDFVNDPTLLLVSNNNGVEAVVQGLSGSITIGTAADCTNDITPPVAICNNQVIANTVNGIATLDVMAFESGSFDNCTPRSDLMITYEDGSTVMDFNIADADINGQIDVAVVIADLSGNVNSCLSLLALESGDCDIDEDDVTFPTMFLFVDVAVNNPTEASAALQPDVLITRPELMEADVFPTLSQIGCPNIGIAFDDDLFVIDANLGWYKVIRTWTVLDWLTGEVYTGNQVIQNYFQADEYICDTLPRSAPIGDCDTGHSLTDDVEWPDDISIADHRIKPDELISASMIDSLDARPIFYDDQQFYTVAYVDVVNTLTQETLIIDRQWTASRTDIVGLSFDYTQMITIDLTTFARLVTVNTLKNRPVPDVDVDGFSATNEQGVAFTDGDVDPNKSDRAVNGLNILDLILMQAHDLGQRPFNEFEIAAGDINGDQEISNLDISSVRRVILGLDDQLSSEWNFIDRTGFSDTGVEPKAHFVAVKPGDVDDSAVLVSDFVFEATESITIRDTLLNAGEFYSIPLFFGRDIQSLGAELHLDFDNTVLDIRSVSSTEAFGEINWTIDGDNRIIILNYNGDGVSEMITTDTPILTLEFEALQNGTLRSADFAIAEERESWIVDEDFSLLRIDNVFTGEIGTNTEELENLGVKVYPNPASDIVTFDISNISITEDYNIQLFDITGRLIVNQNNESIVNFSNVESGMYLYKVTVADKAQTGKLLIKK